MISPLRCLLPVLVLLAPLPGEEGMDCHLDCREHLNHLAALREPLDRAPDDQHLLGEAIMSYVALSLPSPVVPAGDAGPFLDYAQALCSRRRELRHGQDPVTVDEALPELWYAAVAGETRAAITGLERYADAGRVPAGRALRAFATRDWRALDQRGDRTVLEQYALVQAMLESGFCCSRVFRLAPWSRWSPRLRLAMGEDLATVHPSSQLPAAVLDDVVWMLAAREVADGEAVAALTELLTALGGTPGAKDDRAALERATTAAAALMDAKDLRPLMAAWRICQRLAGRAQGIMDGRRHRLVGLGDVARWNRDALAIFLAWHRHHLGWWKPAMADEEQQARSLFADRIGDGFPRVADLLRWGSGPGRIIDHSRPAAPIDEGTRSQVVALLQRELERSDAAPDGQVMAAVAQLALRRQRRGLPDLIAVLERRSQAAGRAAPWPAMRHRWCWTVLWDGIDADQAFRDRLRDWTERDPWDWILRRWWMLMSPGHPRSASSDGADATWVDAQVDHATLPWPGTGSEEAMSTRFSIRWTGQVRIPADGTYRFAIASDDGARLEIGPAVLDQWAYQGMTTRQAPLPCRAGWLPLQLEYFQAVGPAGCRLLWAPPGSDALVPIPADHLAHDQDHQPGLAADLRSGDAGWWQPRPAPDDLAWLQERPWLVEGWHHAGLALILGGRPAEARPWLEAARRHHRQRLDENSALAYALLFQDPPDIEGARALLTDDHGDTYGRFRRDWSDRDGPALLAERICRLHAAERFLLPAGQWNSEYDDGYHLLVAICSLHLGRLDEAAEARAWLLENRKEHFEGYTPARQRQLLLEELALAHAVRWSDSELDAMHALVEDHDMAAAPWDAVAKDWLTGRIDWATAQEHAATTTRPPWIRYYHGLVCLGLKQWDQARNDFRIVVETGPEWTIAAIASGLLHWLEGQTAAQLDARSLGRAITLLPPEHTGATRF